VTVSYQTPKGAKGEIKADYCLCTIPLSVLRPDGRRFFPKTFKAAMDQVAYAPVKQIGLQMKRRFWEEDHAILWRPHLYRHAGHRQHVLPVDRLAEPEGDHSGLLRLRRRRGPDSAPRSPSTAPSSPGRGQKVFPEYTDNFENAFSFSWHLEKNNLGGWAEMERGLRARPPIPVLLEPDGRIYLAGEHLTYTGAWQASAIEVGLAADRQACTPASTTLEVRDHDRKTHRPHRRRGRVSALASSARAQDSAETLFLGNCSAATRPAASAFPAPFRPWPATNFVLGDRDALASLVLQGPGRHARLTRPIWTTPTIATILTYIRASWGNKASPVTAAMVAAARARPATARNAACRPTDQIQGRQS